MNNEKKSSSNKTLLSDTLSLVDMDYSMEESNYNFASQISSDGILDELYEQLLTNIHSVQQPIDFYQILNDRVRIFRHLNKHNLDMMYDLNSRTSEVNNEIIYRLLVVKYNILDPETYENISELTDMKETFANALYQIFIKNLTATIKQFFLDQISLRKNEIITHLEKTPEEHLNNNRLKILKVYNKRRDDRSLLLLANTKEVMNYIIENPSIDTSENPFMSFFFSLDESLNSFLEDIKDFHIEEHFSTSHLKEILNEFSSTIEGESLLDVSIEL